MYNFCFFLLGKTLNRKIESDENPTKSIAKKERQFCNIKKVLSLSKEEHEDKEKGKGKIHTCTIFFHLRIHFCTF